MDSDTRAVSDPEKMPESSSRTRSASSSFKGAPDWIPCQYYVVPNLRFAAWLAAHDAGNTTYHPPWTGLWLILSEIDPNQYSVFGVSLTLSPNLTKYSNFF
jgi:hypothetical protein